MRVDNDVAYPELTFLYKLQHFLKLLALVRFRAFIGATEFAYHLVAVALGISRTAL
ncbi:hypothetical protein JAO76_07785 [Pontibacter sp. BT310]|uniref:IS5/IS1182 family transposase n=1 Tax=Pontibacter populi TaxID=890055 RepID=A0ABS6XBS5_9BACT|nr:MULTISPECIES: hypothetical protein [Pontibacter]MBJ6118085.1 hypothetical protein [Pontibacter sp. BT310]MBR0570512.1 hypothetical protein [Microvirga sp. STS03]MBW3364938.1 hypothetical protein [Pontibacter populi]